MIQLGPADIYNALLVDNVRPPGWKNPTPAGRYNLVVVGAGTAGLVTAAGAAMLGARVALVERDYLGGDCLNTGCVPSKALLRSARAAADVAAIARFGVALPGPAAVELATVMARLRRVRARISAHDSVRRLTDLGVEVFLGPARFTARDALEVGGSRLTFRKAVIATGARPIHPAIPGLADAGFLTSETVFSLTARPSRLAVIGGGPLGCELAQAFRRLGTDVVLVEFGPRLLGREDAEAADLLRTILVRDGVDIRLNTYVTRIETATGEKRIHLRGPGDDVVAVDEILIGVGRAPNVEGLGLDVADVALDPKGVIVVDDRLRTTNPRIYAAGDVCSAQQFTHLADEQARIVIQNSLFLGWRRRSVLVVPRCTYTDPEIAHVGLTDEEAREKRISIDTYRQSLADVDRAVIDDEDDGFVKLHVRRGTGRLVGATIVARHAGEMLNEVTLAMESGLGLATLAHVIHPYPTQAEAIRQAADRYMLARLARFGRLTRAWLALTR